MFILANNIVWLRDNFSKIFRKPFIIAWVMGLDVLNLNIRYDHFIGNYVLSDAAVCLDYAS